jgi:hypothetical protein
VNGRARATRRALVAIGAALIATTSVLVSPAAGGGDPAATAPPSFELTAQDAWTPLGGDLHLQVEVPPSLATEGATLSLTAYQPVTTRSGFDRIVDGQTPSSVLDQVVVPIAGVAAAPDGTRALTVGVEQGNAPRAPERLSLRRTGVFPLVVELRDAGDRVQGSFTTFVVAVATDSVGRPEPLPEPLGVAWVWPLSAGPSTLPDGKPDPTVVDALEPLGRLGRQAVALTRAGDLPLTIVPGPETLEAWDRHGVDDPSIARGAAAIRDAVGRDQIVASSYVPTDLPSLLASNLGVVVDAEFVRGDQTLTTLLGTRPDVRTALARPVDAASLARLRARGVDRVIVDSSSLVDTEDGTAPTRPFTLQPPTSLVPSAPVPAVASDSSITGLMLDGQTSPALRAQRLLAKLSVVALAAPGAKHAVTLVNPSDLDPPQQLLDAILTGLRGNPWLTPMTVDDVFDTVPSESTSNGAPATRELAPYPPPSPPVPALSYAATLERLDSFRNLAGPTDPIVIAGERSMLLSESSTFTGPEGALRARATLNSVRVGIDAFLSRIRVPQPSTITLTSRSGEIPLTFRNETGRPLDVTLQLASEKLTFPEGPTRTLRLPTRSTTLRVPVEARTSGTFPLQMSVTSTDGALTVADRTFRVRSTAFSAVGVILMAGALVFLAVWWGAHIRRSRRERAAAAPTG